MRLRHLASVFTLAATVTALALGQTTASASTGCAAGATAQLNVSAAAAVSTGGHAKLGAAQAQQIASSLRAAGGNICTTPVPAAVQAKLASIASLYKTNASTAHTQLLTFLAGVESGTIHGTLRTVSSARRANGLCPSVSPTIHLSGATKTTADLAAAATAQGAGDNAGATAASAAATSALESWANSSNPTTVGDWITIMQAAQALGDDSLEQSALNGAKSAAEKAVKAAEPKGDLCKASTTAKSCLVQANAIAQMLGADGTPKLDKLLDCGETWTFQMTLAGSGDTGTFGTLVWESGSFLVDRNAKTITDGGGPWPGHITGTYSCSENGHTLESGSMPRSSFTYTLSGKVVATGFVITASSTDAKIPNPFHTKLCRGMGELGMFLVTGFVKQGFPMPFKVAGDAGEGAYNYSASGYTFHATIKRST